MAESLGFDAYEAVLHDLRTKRDEIEKTIAAIEAVRPREPGHGWTISKETAEQLAAIPFLSVTRTRG